MKNIINILIMFCGLLCLKYTYIRQYGRMQLWCYHNDRRFPLLTIGVEVREFLMKKVNQVKGYDMK